MLAHIYRADGREEDIELDYCYSDEEAAIAVCEDGDFGSGDRAIVCVSRLDVSLFLVNLLFTVLVLRYYGIL